MAVFDDLDAEQDALDAILGGLDDSDWAAPSATAGWTVTDVVIHLAQTEEAVTASAAGAGLAVRSPDGATLDEVMDRLVRAERQAPAAVLQRWRTARLAAVAALRAADPDRPLQWAAAPLKPTTLATTRLAEHWAHGLDISGPLGIPFPDTARLRHIAWLAYRTLPYAFALAGEQPQSVFCALTAPDGTDTWRYGSPDADSTITGPAGAFCRVAAQRLTPGQSGLLTSGPHGATILGLLRTYAALPPRVPHFEKEPVIDTRFEVRVGAGTMMAESGAATCFPHRWTPGGVTVEADFTGAHLLHLAAAGCVLNDLYREAAALGIELKGAQVIASGGFDTTTWQSTGIDYSVEVSSDAPADQLARLVEMVDQVAEIPQAIRAGTTVRRVKEAHYEPSSRAPVGWKE